MIHAYPRPWSFPIIPILILIFLQVPQAHSSSQTPFPGNNGQTGLWDMPNARIMPDWHARINLFSADPYRYYGATIGLLDRFEFNGRLTEITTHEGLPGQRYLRDRAIDLKLLLFKERDWLPSIAIGATDMHGTGLFTSRYLVFSKIFRPFDLTLGLGQGILGGEITSGRGGGFARNLLFGATAQPRLFGGIEFHATEALSLVGEYSSLDYEELIGSTREEWPINLGLKYRLSDHLLTSLSWQKGEEVSFGLNLTFPFEPEGLLPWKREPFYTPSEKVRLDAYLAANEALAYIVADQVSRAGFNGVRAAAKGDAIWVEFVNDRYLSHIKAIGRVARIIDLTAPPRIEWFYLGLVREGIILYSFKVHRNVLRAFIERRLDEMATWQSSEHYMGGHRLWHEFVDSTDTMALREAPRGHQRLRIHIAPRIESLLDDPSGFYRASINTLLTLNYRPWKGGSSRAV